MLSSSYCLVALQTTTGMTPLGGPRACQPASNVALPADEKWGSPIGAPLLAVLFQHISVACLTFTTTMISERHGRHCTDHIWINSAVAVL